MKRIKLCDLYKSLNLDPLERLEEIGLLENIFQHLSGNDILRLSEVSLNWNNAIADTSSSMKKITLNLLDKPAYPDYLLTPDLAPVLNGNRRYQNMVWGYFFDILEIDTGLCLLKMAPSLICLEVDCSASTQYISKDLFLPKLDTLIMKKNSSEVVRATEKLRKLTLHNLPCDAEFLDCLNELTHLEELEVVGSLELLFERNLMAEAKFKLKSFTNVDGRLIKLRAGTEFNLHSFLLQMSQSLTHINMSACSQSDIGIIINQMPQLKSFKFDKFLESEFSINLQPNWTITEFKCPTFNFDINKFDFLEALVKVMCGLRILIVEKTNHRLTTKHSVLRNLEKLKLFNILFKPPGLERYEQSIYNIDGNRYIKVNYVKQLSSIFSHP